MGNNNSSVAGASFDSDEIRRLEKRFRKLDTNGSGSLTPDGLSFSRLRAEKYFEFVLKIANLSRNYAPHQN